MKLRKFYKKSTSDILLSLVLFMLVSLAYFYPLLTNGKLWMATVMVSLFWIIFYLISKGKILVEKNKLMWFLSIMVLLIHSYSLKVGEYTYSFLWILFIFLLILQSGSNDILINIVKILYIFTFIYAVSTIVANLGFSSIINNVALLFRTKIYQGTINTAGLTSHYSHNGMYISIGCLCSCAFLFLKNKKSFHDYFFVIFFFAALLFTQKRGPLLAVSLSIIFTCFLTQKETIGRKLYRIMFMIIIVLLIVYTTYIVFPEIFAVFDRFSSDNILSNRQYLWQHAWNLFEENSIIGFGWGYFSHSLSVMINGIELSNQNAHNIYLQLLGETGIIGTILFLVPIVVTLIKSVGLMRRIQVGENKVSIFFSVSVQFYFLIYGLTGNTLYDRQMLIPYMISVLIYYANYNIQKLY